MRLVVPADVFGHLPQDVMDGLPIPELGHERRVEPDEILAAWLSS
jgi:hypothetical protein